MGPRHSKLKRKRNSISVANNYNGSGSLKKEYDFDNPYMIPINDTQIDRMQTQHHILRTLCNGNFLSPIKDKLKAGNFKVLDFGCGTGTWLCDVATDYPSASFVGVDFAPIWPTQKPLNIQFIVANIIDGLEFEDNSFDYIHARSLVTYFNDHEWEAYVIPELTRILKPGGFLECFDDEVLWYNMPPSLEKLCNAIQTELQARHMDPLISRRIGDFMKATGQLENIQHEPKTIPYGSHGGKIGELTAQTFLQFFEGVRKPLMDIMSLNDSEYDSLMSQLEKEINFYRTYGKNHRYIAQKQQK
ncbi:S-adenosyl-L-methionine-dependent methyltransferase [Gigaspora rosea]|uniref:S-adenosyl-L-methionine-dependent methyltransferase n=1 Tax=Gigaspora rosea TaxID=44941 RepID=A0A397VRR3_9GLOM|nr:S-adenosyl-L-methionine-dependent methyltransferase [Gigaspora rosea]